MESYQQDQEGVSVGIAHNPIRHYGQQKAGSQQS